MANTKRNWTLKAVLVTGSRDWGDSFAVHDALDQAQPDLVIHGDCATGADADAAHWSDTAIPMPAPWDDHGRKAGPLRNSKMVEVLKALRFCGYKCEVHAFPMGESPGTRGCMAIAKEAGFTVYDHSITTTQETLDI